MVTGRKAWRFWDVKSTLASTALVNPLFKAFLMPYPGSKSSFVTIQLGTLVLDDQESCSSQLLPMQTCDSDEEMLSWMGWGNAIEQSDLFPLEASGVLSSVDMRSTWGGWAGLTTPLLAQRLGYCWTWKFFCKPLFFPSECLHHAGRLSLAVGYELTCSKGRAAGITEAAVFIHRWYVGNLEIGNLLQHLPRN